MNAKLEAFLRLNIVKKEKKIIDIEIRIYDGALSQHAEVRRPY